MGLLIIILVTVLPSYIFGRYIYKKDPEKKPKKLLAKIMGISILFVIIAGIIEAFLTTILPNTQSFITYLINYILGVALVEEVCKFLPAYWFGVKNKNKTINHKYDIIVYMAFSAIGFATFENLLYVFANSELNTAIYRMIFSVPAHIIYGILMGYFYGIAYQEKQNGNQKQYTQNVIYALLIPTILHGIYDFGITYGVTSSNVLIVITPYIVEIVLLFYAIRKIKKVSGNTEDTEKKKNSGRNLLIVSILLIVLLWLLSNFNIIRLDAGHYNMKENVKTAEDKINLMVESYEENQILGELTINLKLKNSSNQNITLTSNQFILVNMKDTYDIRNSSGFSTANYRYLSLSPNESVTTTITFENVVDDGTNNYLLGYTPDVSDAKTYIIFVGKNYVQALQDRNSKRN